MINPEETILCLDLDDTIYKEIDFFCSGVSYVFSKVLNIKLDCDSPFLRTDSDWFNFVLKNSSISKEELLNEYRFHTPKLSLPSDSHYLISDSKKKNIPLVLITDGRSCTQRNKLMALNILHEFDLLIISEEVGTEKPNQLNYLKVMEHYPNKKYTYIGDNTNKDFITPNHLGWSTICLRDNGLNIHTQNFNLDFEYLPKEQINSLFEIKIS